MPKVSVIMGIYNTQSEDILRKAIQSVLDQSYRDFEFIVCDDGSTDNTFELVKEMTQFDNRVKLIKNERNMGLAYSLNHCLSIASGEYIARMDADDVSLTDRFEKQVNFLDKNKEFALVGSCADLIDKDNIWGFRKVKEFPIKEDFLFGTCFIHPTIMVRRVVLNKINGYRVVPETLRAEDYDLFMRMYAKGYKGYNIQKSLYLFRENNISYKRRSYKYRFGEMKVRYKGFKLLKLFPKGYLYVIKPLVVGIVPQGILAKLRNESLQ